MSSFTPNFDFTKNIIFLAIKSLYKKVHIIIMPELDNVNNLLVKEKKINDPNYFRRINIVYPLINMIPNFKPNIYFPSTREEAYDLLKNKNVTKLTNPFKSIERNFIRESIFFRFYKKKNFLPKYEPNLTTLDLVKKKLNIKNLIKLFQSHYVTLVIIKKIIQTKNLGKKLQNF